MIKIAVANQKSRTKNIQKALSYFEAELKTILKNKKWLLIKPNFVSTTVELSATNVEAVKTLIEFLKTFFKGKILVAEGAALGETFDGFKNFGYDILPKIFKNVELFDLNQDKTKTFKIYDGRLQKTIPVRVAKTFLTAPYIISISPPKTHDTVIVTLSIKNCVMGAIIKGDKTKMHQGVKAINHSIADLAEKLSPDFAILDGWWAMQGDGPVHGEKVEWGIALASDNPLILDAFCSFLMGFDPEDIGYLKMLADKKKIKFDFNRIAIVGDNWQKIKRRFLPHSQYQSQLLWKE